jgi:hypothetical protein
MERCKKSFRSKLKQENIVINSLWIGNELSRLELLTIHSFISQGHTFRLWVYDTAFKNLPANTELRNAAEIIPAEQVFSYKQKNKYGHGKGSYAGFSDIFRYKLLFEKGGWWVDMDVTCLKPLDFNEPYFFRTHHELNVVGNTMKCPANSELMKSCYDEAIASVDETNIDWHRPIQILNSHIEKLQLGKYIQKNVSNPDKWEVTKKYIWTSLTPPITWYFIHWQNEEWRTRKVSKDSFYFRSALGKLMQQYQLSKFPISFVEKFKNRINNSSAMTYLKK